MLILLYLSFLCFPHGFPVDSIIMDGCLQLDTFDQI